MTNRPSTLERLSVAMSTSDLTLDANHRGAADYIIGLGVSAMRNGDVAGTLMHLHASRSAVTIKRAYEQVLGLVKRMNAKRGWGLTPAGVKDVAARALAHHTSPACEPCGGRGYELQPGAPVLSDRQCLVCRGTGRRPIHKRHRAEIEQVITTLELIDDVTERAIAKVVR